MGDRCMLGAVPDFTGFRRIVQGQDIIAFGIDTGQGQGFQRVVYLSGSHPPAKVRLRHGDSRGHFEGNTLVVETTNFSPNFPIRGAAENLTLVERITRLNAKTLEYAVTMTDPTVWSAPWTTKQELTMQSDTEKLYYEPRCRATMVCRAAVGASDDKQFGRERPESGVAGHGELPPESRESSVSGKHSRRHHATRCHRVTRCGRERRHRDVGVVHIQPAKSGRPACAHR
jgi:hypothetical protein